MTEMDVWAEKLRFGSESDPRSDVIVPRRTEAREFLPFWTISSAPSYTHI